MLRVESVPRGCSSCDAYDVLMLGYMNNEALKKTVKSKNVWFYSRSKKRLWEKGESSGNYLKLIDIKSDCDKDALLILAKPA